ncbi:MAG TPA: dipeptidase [Opitutaceae bacterium]|jgi:acetylornithine deacetylase/succinyl-diaminopimelate desuccinylase-like protein|nr:dipeptidase [Opitutaceae bacterium]
MPADPKTLLADLTEFLRIPSQSGSPELRGEIRRAAEWVAQRLRRAGIEHVEILETAGHPVVYGDWLHRPGAPTALIYGHYDVQPPEPLELWTSPPYEPQVRGGKLFARGASDDKGGVAAAIAGIEACLKESAPPINLRFCIEGEEEIGSPNFGSMLAREKRRLAADLVLSADGVEWSERQGFLLLGLRGGCSAEIRVSGPDRDLHSGLYGGAVLNPLEALARLLTSLRHADGRIAIEGFYDDVATATPEDRAEYARVPHDDAAYARDIGVPALHGEPGYSTVERCWIRPTVEINGMWGGHTGPGPKTIIPAQAHAKLTFRLVPNQDPARVYALLERHIARHAPAAVKVEVKSGGFGALPYAIARDHPAVRAAAEVLREVYQVAPYEGRVGGSVPVLAAFEQVLGASAVDFGAATMDANFHSPNEFVYLSSLERAARCFELMVRRGAGLLP